MLRNIDRFVEGYVAAMFWTESYDSDPSLCDNYYIKAIHPESMERIRSDCQEFIDRAQNCGLLDQDNHTLATDLKGNVYGYAGHDFWLTRNRHGCGFWDGDWTEHAGKALTDLAHSFGESYVYVGDDNLIYVN
jgi:hypothetical protein